MHGINRWARYLHEAPATLQRLIARHNRISLPRGCSAEERVQRLRDALIHQRTVRVTYFSLDATTQEALQDLRHIRYGLRDDELFARYGPIRPLKQIAAAPQPQTISERLLLLGWLLPRTSAAGRPDRYLLAPHVRDWLPTPLDLPQQGDAPAVLVPPIVRASSALLLLASEQPLLVRQDGLLRQESIHLLTARLAPWSEADTTPLVQFLLPLLYRLDLLAIDDERVHTTVAGHRFLSRPQTEQRMRVQQTWIGLPEHDRWLTPLLLDPCGIDWPVLRRRLLSWAAELPPDVLLEPATLHDALHAALGPLADPHTHGYRPVSRTPWNARRAAAVFDAALHGPLCWLGIVTWAAGSGDQAAETSDLVARIAEIDEVIPPHLPADFTLPSEQDAASGVGDQGSGVGESSTAIDGPFTMHKGASYDTDIPRPGGLAEEHGTGGGMLPTDEARSSGRAVRPDQPASAGGRLDPGQHRGGARTLALGGLPAASVDSTRLADGSGNAAARRSAGGVPGSHASESGLEPRAGSGAAAQRSDPLPGITDPQSPTPDPRYWHYGSPGEIIIPHSSAQAPVLRLLPFADWEASDATHSTYRITRPQIARAAHQGWSDSVLWRLLDQHAGPPPADWIGDLHDERSRLRLRQTGILIADDPAVLNRAADNRNVRRYLDTRIAPGIALVPPEHMDRLITALARQDIMVDDRRDDDTPPPRLPGEHELTAAECATLLVASAFYRQYAPPEATHLPHADLDRHLRAALTPALRQAVDAALNDLPAPGSVTAQQVSAQVTLAGQRAQRADAQRATAERRAKEWERRARQAEAQLANLQPQPKPAPAPPMSDFWTALSDGDQGPGIGDQEARDQGPGIGDQGSGIGEQSDDQHAAGGQMEPHTDAACISRPLTSDPWPPIIPGSRVRVQFDSGITTVTAPDGTVTTYPHTPAPVPDTSPPAPVPDTPAPICDMPRPAPVLTPDPSPVPADPWLPPPNPQPPIPNPRPPRPALPAVIAVLMLWWTLLLTLLPGVPEQRRRPSQSPILDPQTPTHDPPAAPPVPEQHPAHACALTGDPLPLLRRAIARRHTLEVAYDTGGRGVPETRLIRPLYLEAHGPIWYLRAYCPRAHAERTFRVDRIHACTVVGGRPRRGDPEARRWRKQWPVIPEDGPPPAPPPRSRRSRERASFFPPGPEPGKSRVWLEEG
jgi:hypothetical protein